MPNRDNQLIEERQVVGYVQMLHKYNHQTEKENILYRVFFYVFVEDQALFFQHQIPKLQPVPSTCYVLRTPSIFTYFILPCHTMFFLFMFFSVNCNFHTLKGN